MKNGEVYDVRTEGTSPGREKKTIDFVTKFASPLVNVAAFVESDTHCRHVIAGTREENGKLHEVYYNLRN